MLDSIYISLTGLSGFSQGLKTISNNIANLNTPGFKGSELQFQDLLYSIQPGVDGNGDQSNLSFGQGLQTGGTTILFAQGQLQQTGNALDAAITGNGFFVLQNGNQTSFTRDGQFSIDGNGFLVLQGTGARVQGLVNGQLQDINVNGLQTSPPKATTTVNFTGNLSVNDSDGQQVISNLTVFDATGGSHALTVTFTNNSAVTPGSWLIEVDDANGNVVDTGGQVQFNGDGSPAAGSNTHMFTFSPAGAPPLNLTFNFGTPGGFSGATNFSAGPDSTLAVSSQDGFASGAVTTTTFDTLGNVVLTYSNGQTANAGQLALASFNDLQALDPVGANQFQNNSGQKVQLGTAQTSLFGNITAGSIEGANVDLSQEFSNLIIVQRGFQGSSEVLSVANEMIQDLLNFNNGQQG